MSKYAADTQVAAEKTRHEIESVLERYGADSYFYSSEPGRAIVGFRAHGRTIKMTLPLPKIQDFLKNKRGWTLSQADQQKALDQAVRTKWRCLLLAIKAKLEIVDSGIATFEATFLADIMTADGSTVGQRVAPQIAAEYKTGRPMPLLLGGSP